MSEVCLCVCIQFLLYICTFAFLVTLVTRHSWHGMCSEKYKKKQIGFVIFFVKNASRLVDKWSELVYFVLKGFNIIDCFIDFHWLSPASLLSENVQYDADKILAAHALFLCVCSGGVLLQVALHNPHK